MPKSMRFSHEFTMKIIVAMVSGILFGAALKWFQLSPAAYDLLVNDILNTAGQIFIRLIHMLVVPVVFLSLVCGCSTSGDLRTLGRMGGKTLALYLATTALAVTLALIIAQLFHVGFGMVIPNNVGHIATEEHPVFRHVLLNIFPSNPVQAMAKGNMLQIIVFSIFLGIALSAFKEKSKRIISFFQDLSDVVMRLVTMVIAFTPIGVFCLISALIAKVGLSVIDDLLGYFLVVVLVLLIQLFAVYPALLIFLARLHPRFFFYKMRDAMLFAFSVSSSNASIPIVLDTVKNKLGIKNAIAAFVIPLGATINMDGTAIMQGVATVFIANVYHIHLGLAAYVMVIGMATFASIGTAGVPGAGLITLTVVLGQIGLPTQGIALIVGIDRLLDMLRTTVNISGDAVVACIVGKSEKALDKKIYEH